MSEFLNPVQQALFTRLSAIVTLATIYDDVPDLPDGQPAANFPYIVIGEDVSTPFDTDDVVGSTVIITLHTYTRGDSAQGKKIAKDIMTEIYTALNRQSANLSATGYRFVDCLFDFAEVIDEDDGATRHGVCRYNITIEKE